MTTEERFEAAIKIIRSLPKDGPFQPSHDMMLKFYGLYKQAMEGPCNEPKPAFYEVVKGYKWRAWNNLGNMSKTDAMHTYVEELKKIVETMSYTDSVANFLDALGPFYEYVELAGLKPKNNNTKGLDDSPGYPDSQSKVDVKLTNGHTRTLNGELSSDLDSGSEELQSSSQNSSPELVSFRSNGTVPVPLKCDQDLKEITREEDDEELVVTEVHNIAENSTTHTLTLSPKVYSDSDTDEEYSEPAEISIDHPLLESKMASQLYTERDFTSQHYKVNESSPSTLNTSVGSSNGPVMFGGGDQSHPGGLQMTARQTQGSGFTSTTHYGSGESRGITPTQSGSLVRSSGTGGGAGGGDGRRSRSTSISEDVNAQLVVLLRRLQNDMENVLHRLNTLETLTVTQHHTHCHHCQVGSSTSAATLRSERSWWPFPELSPRSTFFLLIWPVLLHGGIKFLLLLRSRRRRQ
ncbi:Acyl-CoA binding domain containing 5 [Halocaridina rubra]|uniref:Acyl-CoA-binding domain-containing protein 5 n=1 Tax=Halocaridina rubra TaxID=373956 RepID=A0AAN8XC97_HALRR